MHEVRIFYHHLPVCGKVNQSEAIFISLSCRLCLPIVGWCTVSRPTDLGRLRMPAPAVHKIDPWPPLLSHLLVNVGWWVVEKSAFFSNYAETLRWLASVKTKLNVNTLQIWKKNLVFGISQKLDLDFGYISVSPNEWANENYLWNLILSQLHPNRKNIVFCILSHF
jgi:hypothetical protein